MPFTLFEMHIPLSSIERALDTCVRNPDKCQILCQSTTCVHTLCDLYHGKGFAFPYSRFDFIGSSFQ